MTTNLCLICFEPIRICRKKDKQLITPYDPRNIRKINDKFHVIRVHKALLYSLGTYNSETDTYYWLEDHISDRQFYETSISLPLCVWENNYKMLCIHLNNLARENVKSLPLNKKYFTLLYQLLETEVNEYYMPVLS